MAHPSLLPLIRERVGQLLAGYFSAPALSGDLSGYIVAPALDGRAGVLGALELARMLAAGA
jgi:fructokinase